LENDKKRVLVVDASEQVRRLLTETLDGAGYDVVAASNGEEALREIDRQPADMIISDLDMPGLSGVELVQQIRSRKGNRFVPIIMLSVEDTALLHEKGRTTGVSGWLVKPFRPEHVLSVVKLIS